MLLLPTDDQQRIGVTGALVILQKYFPLAFNSCQKFKIDGSHDRGAVWPVVYLTLVYIFFYKKVDGSHDAK